MADAEGAPLVIVKGMAGTAKTFYTLRSACTPMLEQEEPAYRRILISRPNASLTMTSASFLEMNRKKSPRCSDRSSTIWSSWWIKMKRNGLPTSAAFPEK